MKIMKKTENPNKNKFSPANIKIEIRINYIFLK
jgi:hypothetical protein